MIWLRLLLGLLCVLGVEAQNSSSLLQSALQQLPKCAVRILYMKLKQ